MSTTKQLQEYFTNGRPTTFKIKVRVQHIILRSLCGATREIGMYSTDRVVGTEQINRVIKAIDIRDFKHVRGNTKYSWWKFSSPEPQSGISKVAGLLKYTGGHLVTWKKALKGEGVVYGGNADIGEICAHLSANPADLVVCVDWVGKNYHRGHYKIRNLVQMPHYVVATYNETFKDGESNSSCSHVESRPQKSTVIGPLDKRTAMKASSALRKGSISQKVVNTPVKGPGSVGSKKGVYLKTPEWSPMGLQSPACSS